MPGEMEDALAGAGGKIVFSTSATFQAYIKVALVNAALETVLNPDVIMAAFAKNIIRRGIDYDKATLAAIASGEIDFVIAENGDVSLDEAQDDTIADILLPPSDIKSGLFNKLAIAFYDER